MARLCKGYGVPLTGRVRAVEGSPALAKKAAVVLVRALGRWPFSLSSVLVICGGKCTCARRLNGWREAAARVSKRAGRADAVPAVRHVLRPVSQVYFVFVFVFPSNT